MTCPTCLARGASHCDGASCALADPSLPWDRQPHPLPCRACWVRLGGRERHERSVPAAAPAPPPTRYQLRLTTPCRHLGPETGERHDCEQCGGAKDVPVRSCPLHQRCTWPRKLRYRDATGAWQEPTWCVTCDDYTTGEAPAAPPAAALPAIADPDTLVAPLGAKGRPRPWEGTAALKPWSLLVTAAIPHLDTLESLEVCLETIRAQTVRPYLLVIDTGSPPDVCERLERLRAEDLEVHYVRAHAWSHSSEPVAAALDLAHALCRTEYLYHTHSDVFLRRPDWLAWLLARCSPACPVVGYEMSPRAGTEDWRGVPSHTATMVHAPTAHRLGLAWSLQRWYAVHGRPEGETLGWPDTESMFGEGLKAAGVTPFFVTPETCPGARLETNYERHTDVNLDHVRSYPGSKAHGLGQYYVKAERWMREALAEARERAAAWRAGG